MKAITKIKASGIDGAASCVRAGRRDDQAEIRAGGEAHSIIGIIILSAASYASSFLVRLAASLRKEIPRRDGRENERRKNSYAE